MKKHSVKFKTFGMIKISLEKIFHRGSSRIKINAPYDDGLIAFLKTLPTRKFSATLKCWYIDYSGKALSAFYKLDSNKYLVDAKGMVSHISRKTSPT